VTGMGAKRNADKFRVLWGDLKEQGHLEDTEVDGMMMIIIITKYIK
jgi:hypothetical protein